MSKLKLSQRDIRLVEESITHWKRDIQAKLKRGIKIINLKWADNKKGVKCYTGDCPLCRGYYCRDCPYFRKYYEICYDKHWQTFIRNPCLKTCNGMIKALENILT